MFLQRLRAKTSLKLFKASTGPKEIAWPMSRAEKEVEEMSPSKSELAQNGLAEDVLRWLVQKKLPFSVIAGSSQHVFF